MELSKASPNTICFLNVAVIPDMPNNIASRFFDAGSSYVANEKLAEEILIEGGNTRVNRSAAGVWRGVRGSFSIVDHYCPCQRRLS
jgi:hypothetical protein